VQFLPIANYIKDDMKTPKLVIHLARHIPTGAEIPMIVNSIKDNTITDYREFMEKRKGFTISMLQNRWDLCKEDALEMLQKYQVPAHVNHENVKSLPPVASPVDVAIFFEEYIFGLEKKEGLKHTKLKSRTLQLLRNN
jgi:hypothetical protein